MGEMLNFDNRDCAEAETRKSWCKLRNSLANSEFRYDEIDKALSSPFLKAFNDMLNILCCKKYYDTNLGELLAHQIELKRGAKLKLAENATYDRFIPDKKYITENNRFSPSGIEWLYLSIGKPNLTPDLKYSLAEQCCIRECRAETGDRFAICTFEPNSMYYNKNIVDLTFANALSFEEINDELDQCLDKIPLWHQGLYSVAEANTRKWTAYTFAKFLTEQIFTPLETKNKQLIYAPFHCMAQYFITKGYDGIIYSSTVFPQAKNIVLFNKIYARPTGVIRDYII